MYICEMFASTEKENTVQYNTFSYSRLIESSKHCDQNRSANNNNGNNKYNAHLHTSLSSASSITQVARVRPECRISSYITYTYIYNLYIDRHVIVIDQSFIDSVGYKARHFHHLLSINIAVVLCGFLLLPDSGGKGK